jgi:hypothetical protein
MHFCQLDAIWVQRAILHLVRQNLMLSGNLSELVTLHELDKEFNHIVLVHLTPNIDWWYSGILRWLEKLLRESIFVLCRINELVFNLRRHTLKSD